jgi:hypothetical protein
MTEATAPLLEASATAAIAAATRNVVFAAFMVVMTTS